MADTSYFVAASGVVTPTLNPPPVSIQDSTGNAFTSLNPLPVSVVSGGGGGSSVTVTNFPATQAVTGTFWQATQPISAAALPLPSGASTEATLSSLNTKIPSSLTVTSTRLLVDGSGVTQPVSGTFWQATQPVSLASLPALATGGNVIGSISNTSFAATQATPASLQMTATQALGTAATRWFAQLSDGTNSPAIKAASTAAAATDPALTVAISPNNSVAVTQATAANLNATVAQGAPAAVANSWYAKLSDGTNGPVAVKAASTAAAFTDAALTVDPRPGGALVTASASLADGLANPSLGRVAVLPAKYNGTTWDLDRGNWNTTTGDTGAKTTTFNGATQTNFSARGAYIDVFVSAVSGTSPTLTCQLQWSPDNGTSWINFGPASATISAASSTVFVVYPTNISQSAGATPANISINSTTPIAINAPLPRTWRIAYTIGGTTPSFTITQAYVSYVV